MSIIEERILPILESYVSRINAQVMINRALRELGTTQERVTEADLGRVCESLRKGLSLFVDSRHRADLAARIDALAPGGAATSGEPVETKIAIRAESDIGAALLEARRLCEIAGARSFPVQKVTTIVSELARNIVNYTPGGSITLSLVTSPRQAIEIVAVDSGGGVPNLDLVLSGKYKSRTGMGRGIVGCQRLADDFKVDTGSSGTRVFAMVRL